jgi:hypothetical protein
VGTGYRCEPQNPVGAKELRERDTRLKFLVYGVPIERFFSNEIPILTRTELQPTNGTK